MNLIAHIVIWAVLATVVVFLAVWRRKAEMQTAAASRGEAAGSFAKLDFWGTLLTVLTIAYAAAILVMLLF